MTHRNAMSSWLRLSVALLVAILPGLLASPLEAVNLLERGMLKAATKDPLCKDQLTSCDGCNKIRNCVKIGKTYFNTGNPTECVYGTPWCGEENGAATCVATAPTDSTCNKPTTADFVCTQTGYFPDMLDCIKYYVCVEDPTTKELVSYAYDCSAFPDVRYDAATAQCKLGSCYRLSCPHPYGASFQIWGQAPWIYASCMDSDPKNALVAACPHGQAWDGENCVQACQEEGRFAAMSDNTGTRFIECVIIDIDGKLSEPVHGVCPPGAIFSTAESICVDAPAATTLPPTTAAPATTVPATAAPATTVPATAAPATTVPATAAPATKVPATAAPATTVPSTAAPATTVPATAAPATTVPATAAPATTVPATAAPATTVPATAAPATTVPATAAPATTVPATAAPATTVPSTAAPATTVPATAAPATTVPATAAPATTVPATAAPATTVPASAAPATTVPSTAAPATTVPATAAPATTVPATAAPATTVPATAAPATTVPATAAPATTVPATAATATPAGTTARPADAHTAAPLAYTTP